MFQDSSIFSQFKIKLLLLCFSLLSTTGVYAQQTNRENLILSAFVYKLAKFVTWSHIKPASDLNYFDLCVVNHSSFSQSLKRAVISRKISNLKIVVRNVSNVDNIDHCHLLYFQGVNAETVVTFLNESKGKPILTIANSLDFISHGGMIELERADNKMTLSINNEKAKQEGLLISAHLLRLNRIKQ